MSCEFIFQKNELLFVDNMCDIGAICVSNL